MRLAQEQTFVKSYQLMAFDPRRFVFVNLFASGALGIHNLDGLRKRLNIFGNSENELMISRVNRAAQKLTTFRISSSDDQIFAAHKIPLKPGGYQTIDVLPHRY